MSFHRTSPDVVRHGDDITIDWEVQDSPAKNVIFYLRDRLGSDLQVRWDAPNGTSAYSGTARFTVDETSLATGDLTLWGFGAGNGYASVSYRTDGTIYKSPR
ncbi:hypothetical protein [Arthrobacter sp. OAP107]|uniref:hypothetical protein n=1 Tax=Arthrobacter sp. OAP107 TaxID=3156445 RepID=UPI003395166B